VSPNVSTTDPAANLAVLHLSAVTLSVIIPAFNEAATIEAVLDGVWRTGVAHQIILVDDGGTDQTGPIASRWAERTGRPVIVVTHRRNLGKGRAIRSGLEFVTGSHVVIQDADLECDPTDLIRLLAVLNHDAPVVYGSRYLGGSFKRTSWTWNRLGVSLLNAMLWSLYGRSLSDEAACYKLLPTPLLKSLDLRCRRFEFCPEVTAKLCRLNWPIVEVPVKYHPRSAAEGKKLQIGDGFVAILSLLRWRISPLPPAALRRQVFNQPLSGQS